MNELKTIDYSTLTGNTRGQLKRAYNSIEKNMITVATYCYQLNNEDSELFKTWANNELGMSKGTLSKFVTVGKIINECEYDFELPNQYSKIYELVKVSDDLNDFNDYFVEINEKELKDGTNKEISITVKKYLGNSNQIESETETKTETDAETETETETENIDFENIKNIILSNIESVRENEKNPENVLDLVVSVELLISMIK